MPSPVELELPLPDGQKALVRIRSLKQARNLTLRFDDRDRCFRLSIPHGFPPADAAPFLEKKREWMAACLLRAPERMLADGKPLMLNGREHRLVFSGAASRSVTVQGADLIIGGPADLAPARLKRFLIAAAKDQLVPQVETYASTLGGDLKSVKFGDMRSRWGSCATSGTIKLSWRLVMAPASVQAYVAAHEASHLIEMNHSDRFWAVVESLVPNWRAERRWLRTRGPSLQSVPFPK